ncbi:MAG: hypothetical protein DWQ01_14035 [Planctomycetota bacterium]|nr:MAG: hypothetical protein DWQ01_14035 [Planctomycetota bacterium]
MILLAPLACGPGEADGGLELLDWPGHNGQPVVLDQPLRLRFNLPLDAFLRRGAFDLQHLPEGRSVAVAGYEVLGNTLKIQPELPRKADLSDGSLVPGSRYRLVLHGLPRLAAVAAIGGQSLVGQWEVEFETLGAEDEVLFSVFAPPGSELILRQEKDGLFRRLALAADGTGRVGFRQPLDPRPLGHAHAELLDGKRQRLMALPMDLEENHPNGAVLRIRIPRQPPKGQRWFVALPENLMGLGAERLNPHDRLLMLLPPNENP